MVLSNFITGRKATENQLRNYDPDSKNMVTVLYQSGYLTIKDFEKNKRIYFLNFPNKEIESVYLDVLLQKFVKIPEDDIGRQ